MDGSERRRFQRLKLAKPILAGLSGENALLLDIGVRGALIEHYGEAKAGQKFILSFKWQGSDITYNVEVARTFVLRPAAKSGLAVSQSALRFLKGRGDSDALLRDMMATFVGRILAAQRANARSNTEESSSVLHQLGQARRARTKGYLAYLWNGTTWTVRRTDLPNQPKSGFTVAAYEDEEELESLCKTYEVADEEGRKLIRLVAELSVLSTQKQTG
jgi:hypothetical protein